MKQQKGYGYYISYNKTHSKSTLKIIFGPSEWQIEILIRTKKGEFAFKDLLSIPEITSWVNRNPYSQGPTRNIEAELQWYIKLLDISMPYVE